MTVTWEVVLEAYRQGLFPMAPARDSAVMEWYSPLWRGVLPLDDRFHIPRSLARFLRRTQWQITADKAFPDVIHQCAVTRGKGRDDTWISHDIERLYTELHVQGYAHSIEVWDGEKLIGGLYGLKLGAVFFAESMFSHESNASKVALVHLVNRLRAGAFTLLDTQYVNAHLRQFGVMRVARKEYHALLARALSEQAEF